MLVFMQLIPPVKMQQNRHFKMPSYRGMNEDRVFNIMNRAALQEPENNHKQTTNAAASLPLQASHITPHLYESPLTESSSPELQGQSTKNHTVSFC